MLGFCWNGASGQPLETFLRERLFEPLGMVDTSFSVPAEKQRRFTTAYMPDETGAQLHVLDPPSRGWWNEPPAMANPAGMLVSTLDDYWAFVSMLVAKGLHDGRQLLSPGAVEAMTSDHLTAAQRAVRLRSSSARTVAGAIAWPRRDRRGANRRCRGATAGTGGRAPRGRTDPDFGLTGILLSTRAMTSPETPAHIVEFWEAAYGALAG